uniref:Dirigent protein n=1 Tax=Nelumbo nucifera TaxID=4432 RepID=A0A822YM97_NELNU|nr:TPA_asm: hypothetical protein HUJ06_010877 [Nelumbo nucifera]
MDNPLIATPDINSTLMGRAQGLYAMFSQQNNSLSVVGRNPILNEVREMPIVKGTGVFRIACGYCLAKNTPWQYLMQ